MCEHTHNTLHAVVRYTHCVQVCAAAPAVWQCGDRQMCWLADVVTAGTAAACGQFPVSSGGTCALFFKVPTPLRWKFLRFPNVTLCTVQLTTHICWLLNTHITQNIHTLTLQLLPLKGFLQAHSGEKRQLYNFTSVQAVVALPLASSASCVSWGHLYVYFFHRIHVNYTHKLTHAENIQTWGE